MTESTQKATHPLPRRRLGKTGLNIPVIPFGTQGFGNNFGFVSDEDAVALIKHAISLGVNHFDCARCYGDSLRKLGLAMKEIPRQDVIITGRLCCHSAAQWGFYGEGTPDYSAERVIRDVEDQLTILNIDYFDGMLIHDPVADGANVGERWYARRRVTTQSARSGAQCGVRHAPTRFPFAGDCDGRCRSALMF